MNLRVAYDTSIFDLSRTGIARATYHLALAIAEHEPDVDLVPVPLHLWDYREGHDLAAWLRARFTAPTASGYGGKLGTLRRIFREQVTVSRAVRAAGVDLFHAPAYAPPVRCACPRALSIYDMAYLLYPGNVSRLTRWYWWWAYQYVGQGVDAIIVPSTHTAEDVARLTGFPHDRIHVAYLGVDTSLFFPADIAAQERARERYDLPGRYILAVGTLEPRKNLMVLLRAYAKLSAEIRDEVGVVLTGACGYRGQRIVEEAQRLGITSGLRLTGFVDDDDLRAIYSAADLFAMPSRYEGFGLPVLEAMACETPVVISHVSSLPEVAGDAALMADPDDVEAWRDTLAKVLADSALRERLAIAGAQRAQAFTWKACARQTVAAYRAVWGR